MQVPKRRSESQRKYAPSGDNFLSPEAVRKLEDELRRLQERSRPRAVADLSAARDMGDLSENAAYSEAKGRLFGIDRRIFEIKEKLKNAVIVRRGADEGGHVRIGATVIVRVNGKERTYEITGSQEADPSTGRISHLSPLGSALLGRKAGEKVAVKNAQGKDVGYDILDVK